MKHAELDRRAIADLILDRLVYDKEECQRAYTASKDRIGHFYVDNLLPEELAMSIYELFPTQEEMVLKKSIRENKRVAAQMDQYHPLLEECIYAFQDPRVVDLVNQICGLDHSYPDENLYAGGLSSMADGQFLNPHLDNSHDKDRDRWRVLNLLYYVTPDWQLENGGHLELWPEGIKGEAITIESRFNRLAVMATHQASWHSVSPVSRDDGRARNCVSNYYFSDVPLREDDSFHVTSFRGRPEQKLRDKILQFDAFVRMGLRKVFRKGVRENPHVYKKK